MKIFAISTIQTSYLWKQIAKSHLVIMKLPVDNIILPILVFKKNDRHNEKEP